MSDAPVDLTGMLRRWAEGDQASASQLIDMLYTELKAIASRQLARERAGHTLQPTALVHEAYLKLLGCGQVDWQSRGHFLALSARLMRQLLIDRGRHRQVEDRKLGERLSITLAADLAVSAPLDLLDLDRALTRLGELNPEYARLIELRYFGGLTIEECAGLTGVSVSSVNRAWRASNTWLKQAMDGRP